MEKRECVRVRVRVGYRTLQLTLGICCMVTLGIAINLTFTFSFPQDVRDWGRNSVRDCRTLDVHVCILEEVRDC